MAHAAAIKVELLSRLESVLEFLFPSGQVHGKEFRVGSLAGEAGESLKVQLTGPKRGVWSDFSPSGVGGAGDILELWIKRNNFSKFHDAAPGLHEYLGISMEEDIKPKKKYTKPELKTGSAKPARDYLIGRGISGEVLTANGIGCHDGAVVFPYREAFHEDPMMIKYLSLKRGADGSKKVWCSTDTKPILFGMGSPLVVNASGALTLCEGEIDCLSWQTAGVPAVSVPFGAKEGSANDEWWTNCYSWLQQFHTVYVSMDMDAAGQAAAKDIMKRLGHDRSLLVSLPKKDANECLMAGVDLKACLNRARVINPDGIKLGSEMGKETWSILHKGPVEDQGLPLLDWDMDQFKFRLRPREGTLVTGFSNHGKSTFCYQLFSWLASQGEACFIGSYESKAARILSIMAMQALGRQFTSNEYHLFNKVKDALLDKVLIHDYEGTVKYKDFFTHATYAHKKFGAGWALLDSVSCTDVCLDDNKSCEDFMKAAQDFWKRTGVHLVVIFHPRKSPEDRNGESETKPPTKASIKGSGFFADLSDNILSVWKHPSQDKSSIGPLKRREGGPGDHIEMYFDPESKRFMLDGRESRKPYIKI